jgi:hypothetical protein
MKFLVVASLLLGFSNVALAQAGCGIDPGNGAVGNLKDVHLQFKPNDDRPNQICTGDGTICLYSKDNGKTPCSQTFDADTHKPTAPELCGPDLLKAQNDAGDNQYQSSSQNNRGASGPQTNNFYYSFVKMPSGKYLIDIEPQQSADNSKRASGKDFKIKPSDAMGSNDVVLETYDGGGDPLSQCPIETSSQGLGQAAGACPEPIKLAGTCTARRDAGGNWYSVSNDKSPNAGKVTLTPTKAYGNVSTNGGGNSSASSSTAGSF